MNAEQAWQATLGQLQMEMSKAAFDTWVRDAELVSYEDGRFTIGVKNAYARDWLEGRLSSTVTRMLSGMVDRPAEIAFTVWQAENEPDEANVAIEPEPVQAAGVRFSSATICGRYTFDNSSLAPATGWRTRLLWLWLKALPMLIILFPLWRCGFGQDPLAACYRQRHPIEGLQVLYVSSEEFTNDLISAIRSHSTPAFREKYRQNDVC